MRTADGAEIAVSSEEVTITRWKVKCDGCPEWGPTVETARAADEWVKHHTELHRRKHEREQAKAASA